MLEKILLQITYQVMKPNSVNTESAEGFVISVSLREKATSVLIKPLKPRVTYQKWPAAGS